MKVRRIDRVPGAFRNLVWGAASVFSPNTDYWSGGPETRRAFSVIGADYTRAVRDVRARIGREKIVAGKENAAVKSSG